MLQGIVTGRVDPAYRPAAGVYETQSDCWVWFSGPGVPDDFLILGGSDVVYESARRHLRFIQAEKSDLGRVRVPPVRLELSAAVEFLLVDPVEATHQ